MSTRKITKARVAETIKPDELKKKDKVEKKFEAMLFMRPKNISDNTSSSLFDRGKNV